MEDDQQRSRAVSVAIAVTALLSFVASVALMVVLLQGGPGDRDDDAAAVGPSGARPAAFQQTSDGVIVVPPVVEDPVPDREPQPEKVPDTPEPAAVARVLEELHVDIAACARPAQVSGEVAIKMRLEPDGKVAWTAAKVSSSPFQSCLDRLFKKARMPRSAKGATITQTVQLP
jgi:hypothetical protein